MTTLEPTAASKSAKAANPIYTKIYRVFAYFGVMTVSGSLLYGFRYSPSAPASNYVISLVLYGIFIVPHLLMTRGWWKNFAWGTPAGSPRERRLYITVTIVMWLGVLWLHPATPGGALALSAPLANLVRFIGTAGFLFFVVKFFEGSTLDAMDRLLGVPGNPISHTHGSHTPLFTEGPYARVRHPMYQAALCYNVCSLLIHPNMAQMFWAVLIGITFIGFVPIEEAQLLDARGDDYRRYQERVPYRLFRGIW